MNYLKKKRLTMFRQRNSINQHKLFFLITVRKKDFTLIFYDYIIRVFMELKKKVILKNYLFETGLVIRKKL